MSTRREIALARRKFPGGDSFYSLQADKAMLDIASSSNLPMPMRLYMLACSRANIWGHAPFLRGELGETLKANTNTLRRSRTALIKGKVIAPESTNLCIVLSHHAWTRSDSSMIRCSEPHHALRQELRWAAGWGWESEPGEWAKLVIDPRGAERYAQRITETTETVTTTKTHRVTETVADPWGYVGPPSARPAPPRFGINTSDYD